MFKKITAAIIAFLLTSMLIFTNIKNEQDPTFAANNTPEWTDQITEDGFAYIINNDGNVEISGYKLTEADSNLPAYSLDITFPNQIEGKPVVAVAFHIYKLHAGTGELRSVVISDGIKKISDGAFSECSNLVNIIIPNSITYIGGAAFVGCDKITDIIIPDSVTYIGRRAFSGCTKLTDITIPASVTYIGEYAFEDESVFHTTLDTTIHCYSGSYAEQYAEDNNVPYVLIDAPTQEPSESPNPTQEPTPTPDITESPAPSTTPDASEAPTQVPVETEKPVVYGDANGDGEITSSDALNILQYVVKLKIPTAEQIHLIDLNNSGDVDSGDALLVLQKVVHLIDEFPPRE